MVSLEGDSSCNAGIACSVVYAAGKFGLFLFRSPSWPLLPFPLGDEGLPFPFKDGGRLLTQQVSEVWP